MLFEVKKAYMEDGCVMQPGEVFVAKGDWRAVWAIDNGYLRKMTVKECNDVFRQFCREAGANTAGEVLMALRATLPVRRNLISMDRMDRIGKKEKTTWMGRMGAVLAWSYGFDPKISAFLL